MIYVAGFLFSPDYKAVALILKNRPTFQAGKFNGIGGKVEPKETLVEAMEREFMEEAGVKVIGWQRFATLAGGQDGYIAYNVHFFVAVGIFDGIHSVTDEKITVMAVSDVPSVPRMPNLDWLIPMAINVHRKADSAGHFSILEG